jgi:hypothetical protein
MEAMSFFHMSASFLMLLIMIQMISGEELVDIEKVRFKFSHGISDCEGITQYCSEDIVPQTSARQPTLL